MTLTQTILFNYFLIGSIFTICVDLLIRFIKTSEPYNIKEIFISIIIWPVIATGMVISFFKGMGNV
jgi:hypothetical protein